MCEDDRIVAQLGDRMALLEETLQSHRAAMALNTENVDVRFNTAQVLTSLAEGLLEMDGSPNAKVLARPRFEEAVELFTKCLASQQQEYEQIRNDLAAAAQTAQEDQDQQELNQQPTADEAKREESMETESTTSSGPGEWANVEEPLTPETILETCTAQLSALTTLLGLYDPADFTNIDPRAQIGQSVVNTSVPTLITLLDESPYQKVKDEPTGPTLSIASSTSESFETTPKEDAELAVAVFTATLAEHAHRRGQTTPAEYATVIEELFAELTRPTPSPSPAQLNVLSAHADALIDLSSAIADTPIYTPASAFLASLETQWRALSQAQKLLTQLSSATSVLPASRLADVFLARGDTDLCRFRIAKSIGAKSAWTDSSKVLVSNAGVWYRGARTYAGKAGKETVERVADAKAVVAEVLKEGEGAGWDNVVAKEEWKGKGETVKRVLEGMIEEGILGKAWEAERVLGLVQ
jgi:hypothetical protein